MTGCVGVVGCLGWGQPCVTGYVSHGRPPIPGGLGQKPHRSQLALNRKLRLQQVFCWPSVAHWLQLCTHRWPSDWTQHTGHGTDLSNTDLGEHHYRNISNFSQISTFSLYITSAYTFVYFLNTHCKPTSILTRHMYYCYHIMIILCAINIHLDCIQEKQLKDQRLLLGETLKSSQKWTSILWTSCTSIKLFSIILQVCKHSTGYFNTSQNILIYNLFPAKLQSHFDWTNHECVKLVPVSLVSNH